jgi:tetratricopeptide (TPR) repeat protein
MPSPPLRKPPIPKSLPPPTFWPGSTSPIMATSRKPRRYYESALRFQPDNSTLLIYYAATLMRTGQASEALPYAQHAASVDPNSADAVAMLGFVQYASDHTPDAIRSWKKSLALRPDATVSQYLARAERESTAESDFSQRESSHFNLHFEGKDTSEAFPPRSARHPRLRIRRPGARSRLLAAQQYRGHAVHPAGVLRRYARAIVDRRHQRWQSCASRSAA